jgi:hypothetical protein
MPHDKPIGIDLGTSNSAMACVDETGRSAMIANAEGELITPIGRCTVADLLPGLPAKSPVDVIFNYQSDGRLKVRVQVPGPGVPGAPNQLLDTEIVRENGLSKQHMDAWWRQFISGKTATDYR